MKIRALSIAGFDGSGGAGIQADLKTFSALGVYGMSVLTALPVQNTQGVRNVWPLSVACVSEQLDAIFDDVEVHVIKMGMLFDAQIIEAVAHFLLHRAQNIPIVLDPVMVAKNGGVLLKADAIDALKTRFMPLATICTPNIPEAEVLTQTQIENVSDMERVARDLVGYGSKAILLKGGHLSGEDASDFFIDGSEQRWIESQRIVTLNTHGTGCTLSAAVAAYLAKGLNPFDACREAKQYLTRAILGAKDVHFGKGHGPVHHFCDWW